MAGGNQRPIGSAEKRNHRVFVFKIPLVFTWTILLYPFVLLFRGCSWYTESNMNNFIKSKNVNIFGNGQVKKKGGKENYMIAEKAQTQM